MVENLIVEVCAQKGSEQCGIKSAFLESNTMAKE